MTWLQLAGFAGTACAAFLVAGAMLVAAAAIFLALGTVITWIADRPTRDDLADERGLPLADEPQRGKP